MSVHAILPLLSSIIFIIAGLVVFLINKGSEKNAFLRFCYLTFHWQFAWFLMFSIGNEQNSMLIGRIGYSGIIFIPAAFYDAMCSYFGIKNITAKISYIISLFFLISLWTSDYFISGCYLSPFGYYPKAGVLHIAYMILVAYSIVKLIISIRIKLKDEKEKRSQNITFFIGLLIYAGAAIDYLLNYPDILDKCNIELYPVGVFFIIISLAHFLVAHKNRINIRLEKQVEERTEEIRKKTIEIEKSLALLQEAQEAKKKFISSIAHDLRNPLSVISGYSDLLHRRMEPGTKEYCAVETIKTCINQTSRLLESLIQISLLESNELKPDLEIHDYSNFVYDYVKRFEEKAMKNNIELSFNVLQERIVVKSDILWLERILGNLIQNAFKYVKTGGKITVKSYVEKENVYTEVADTGIGIPKEKIEFIFERKYQAHKELKKEGFGLGLSIVKEMLELLGGTIRVESEINVGSRFIYSIPLYTDQKAITKNESGDKFDHERRSGKDRRKESRINEFVMQIEENRKIELLKLNFANYENKKPDCKTILICDDNPTHLQLVIDKLSESYNLLLADNGDAGLKKLYLYNHMIDLVITDVEMPEMSGLELCKKINKSDKLKMKKVIVMSSYYNETDKEYALKNGAVNYIGKDKSKEELVELINEAVCNVTNAM